MSDEATTATTTTATTTAPVTTQTSGVQEPWAKDWIKSDYSFDHKALERLPDHLKGLKPTLERSKSLEDFLVTFQNQNMLVGKKALAPLPADAPEAVRLERKQLIDTINGVPPAPKDYGITRPQDFPEEHWNQPLADKATAWAHKHSVSPAAMKELVYEINGGAIKESIASQGQYVQQFYAEQDKRFEAALKQANIPSDRAAGLVEKGALALGLDLSQEDTKNFMKGSEARLMAMKHAIAIGEDHAVTDSGTSSTGDDPAALAKDAQSNPANPLHAQYWNKDGKFSRATQDAAIAKVNGWLQIAAGRGAKTR